MNMFNESVETILLGAVGSIIGAIIIYLIVTLYKSLPTYKKNFIVSLHIKTVQGYSDIYTNNLTFAPK